MNKSAAWIFLILIVLFVFGFFTMLAHGSTTKPRPNSVGVYDTYTNPNLYMLALPIEGQVLEGVVTNIRFRPYNTMLLFDEAVVFCGDIRSEFNGKVGPVVVTYEAVAHRRYRGVACHDLVSVFEVHMDQVEILP